MKKLAVFFIVLLLCIPAVSQILGDNKTAKIISFRIEANNPGIDERDLIIPLNQQLSRVFRFSEVSLASNIAIEWKNENPFNKFKKLSNAELRYTSVGNSEVLLKIEIEHRYNQVLGGLIKKGKRHVMRLKIAMFTSTGERVWYHKKKNSCCIDLGVSEEEEYLYQDMDAASFLDLYKSVVDKTFSKL